MPAEILDTLQIYNQLMADKKLRITVPSIKDALALRNAVSVMKSRQDKINSAILDDNELMTFSFKFLSREEPHIRVELSFIESARKLYIVEIVDDEELEASNGNGSSSNSDSAT